MFLFNKILCYLLKRIYIGFLIIFVVFVIFRRCLMRSFVEILFFFFDVFYLVNVNINIFYLIF